MLGLLVRSGHRIIELDHSYLVVAFAEVISHPSVYKPGLIASIVP